MPQPPLWALAVDDHEGVRDSLALLLPLVGFACDTAADGREALARFEAGAYDLIVTDLVMPGLDGWGLAHAIRQRAPGTPILLVTGAMTREAVTRARVMAWPLLAKPFTLAELRAAIEEALRGRETGLRQKDGPALLG
jgi:two-component system cell cycle response regulator CpdR